MKSNTSAYGEETWLSKLRPTTIATRGSWRVPPRLPNPLCLCLTGRGSQELRMGIEQYNSSAACAVGRCRRPSSHCLLIFVIKIAKNNPKTIHFGGIKGRAIRARYMEMSYDTMDKDGVVRTLPLFSDSAPSDTHSATLTTSCFLLSLLRSPLSLRRKPTLKICSRKVLFRVTQSLLVTRSESTLFSPRLLVSSSTSYSTVASPCSVRIVERDSANGSNYAMCAVNPSRISPSFNDSALREVVDESNAKLTACWR